MNKAKYVSLSEAQRRVTMPAAVETTAVSQPSRAVYAQVFDALKAKGVQVNTVDTAPFQSMVDRSMPSSPRNGARFRQSVCKATRAVREPLGDLLPPDHRAREAPAWPGSSRAWRLFFALMFLATMLGVVARYLGVTGFECPSKWPADLRLVTFLACWWRSCAG